MEKIKNVKVIYLVAILVILAGIIVTCIWKTNFSLEYREHVRIDVYFGKEYNMDDLKQIAEEVFPNKKIEYQEIEFFHDSIAMSVEKASDEQIALLKEKVKDKFEIEKIDNQVSVINIPHYRVRDMVKQYIVPMIITTIMILAYVGIRYLNLGIFKVVGTLFIRLMVSELVLASVIEILRIPVGMYIVPVAILVYLFITTLTVTGYETQSKKEKQQGKKKK